MNNKTIEIILRSISSYIILLILGRLIGRKLISRITFFDFLVGVTIGSVAVRMALGSEDSLFLAIISAAIITILVIITDYLHIKSFKFRKLIGGEPIILIKNGNILDYNLKKSKVTINDLIMQLREKDIFNIGDVEFAVMEIDGELSVLPKPNKQPITTGDLNILRTYKGLTSDVIIDGKIIYDNLKYTNYDEYWLRKQLKTHNIKDVKDVFYAGLDTSGNLYVSPKKK
ncbi:DUF421 domain-containing protein [Clostridium polyendosporum]|uniref:DUF421 domain-containing protein n=1 Tax=Clostridium polyendosporum TaxID=69208 RepID=A0A919RWY6_9CLOT|nr:DUF421 domain-containing protein [Clostridium polyendosporum]GIM27995.1 DUF421 domain-containing protein [Clostridium polyendosporum]